MFNTSIDTLARIVQDAPVDLGAEATLRKIVQDAAIAGPISHVIALSQSLIEYRKTELREEAEKN